MHRLNNMKCELINWLQEYMACGRDHFDTEFAGDVTDMIKDICEAEEKMAKAKYYCALTTEMEEDDGWVQENMPHYRSRYGYPRRDFNPSQHPRNAMGEFKNRAGYPKYSEVYDPTQRRDGMDTYSQSYQHPYDEWKEAKRHYTETKDPHHKMVMDEKTKESAEDAINIMKDIWADANPELKKSMKAEVTNLLSDMSRV